MASDVKPIKLTDNDNGKVYTLEFNREAVIWCENKGVRLNNLNDITLNTIQTIWVGAFKYHHPEVSQTLALKLLDEVKLSQKAIERLLELYALPYNTLLLDEDNGESKNSRMVVEI